MPNDIRELKKIHTPDEIVALVNWYLAKGEKLKAKHIMVFTTDLRNIERREIAQGLRQLRIEDITKTDLRNIDKFGCSLGSAALILTSCFIMYNFMF